jgi:hypothetical protein
MVTDISGAGLSHSVVAPTSTAVTSRVAETARSGQPGATSEVASRDKLVSTSAQVAGAYAQLRGRQDVLNQAASVVREVGNTADKADQLLTKMEESLGQVVKMYPPYPVDNPERVTLLNSFGGLRRQIDALTFPPPETLDAVGRLLGAPEDPNAKDATSTERQSIASLVKEPMWDIPTLDPLSASDADVSKALDQVEAMKKTLEDLQSGMWQDVVSYVKQADTPEARNEAADVRDQLTDLAGEIGGIGRNARQLEAAAESK